MATSQLNVDIPTRDGPAPESSLPSPAFSSLELSPIPETSPPPPSLEVEAEPEKYVPRPLNSFFLFRLHCINTDKYDVGSQRGNIGKFLAEIWKALPEDSAEKRYWKQRAIAEKIRHRNLHPNYVYASRMLKGKPRRSAGVNAKAKSSTSKVARPRRTRRKSQVPASRTPSPSHPVTGYPSPDWHAYRSAAPSPEPTIEQRPFPNSFKLEDVDKMPLDVAPILPLAEPEFEFQPTGMTGSRIFEHPLHYTPAPDVMVEPVFNDPFIYQPQPLSYNPLWNLDTSLPGLSTYGDGYNYPLSTYADMSATTTTVVTASTTTCTMASPTQAPNALTWTEYPVMPSFMFTNPDPFTYVSRPHASHNSSYPTPPPSNGVQTPPHSPAIATPAHPFPTFDADPTSPGGEEEEEDDDDEGVSEYFDPQVAAMLAAWSFPPRDFNSSFVSERSSQSHITNSESYQNALRGLDNMVNYDYYGYHASTSQH